MFVEILSGSFLGSWVVAKGCVCPLCLELTPKLVPFGMTDDSAVCVRCAEEVREFSSREGVEIAEEDL